MPSGASQLSSDFEQVQQTLELYPSITIVKTSGEPPDHYEIEYRVRGYVTSPDGSVAVGEHHLIRIDLPFGYPHFAPTVKPLTPLFHPDIDPDAIRIADFWEKNPALAELIIHIGEMITGSCYNTREPFNPEAAKWYASHRDELPLDSLQIADIIDSEEPDDLLPEEDSFAELGLMDEDPEEEEITVEDLIDLIRFRFEQGELAGAAEKLAQLPAGTEFPGREEIEQALDEAMQRAQALFNESKALEQQGKLQEALNLLGRLDEIVADYPGLDELRQRIQESLRLTRGVDPEQEKSKPRAAEESATPPPPPKGRKAGKGRSGIGRAGLRIAILGLVICLAGGAGYLYFQDKSNLEEARTCWQQVRKLAKAGEYTKAEKIARELEKTLGAILVLRSDKAALEEKLTRLRSTRDYKEGLRGRVLYQGKYIDAALAKILLEYDRLVAEAQGLREKGEISAAMDALKKAQSLASSKGLKDQARDAGQELIQLRLAVTLREARDNVAAGEWEHAVEKYQQVLELAGGLDSPPPLEPVRQGLARASFKLALTRARKSFGDKQWTGTLAALGRAKSLLQAEPAIASPEEQQEIERLALDARLYQMLGIARRAYEEGNWDLAIGEYEKVLNFLREKKQASDELDDSVARVERTLLMVRIAREQREAAQATEAGDLDQALAHYRKILETISQSPFAGEPSLGSIAASVQERIAATREQLDIQEKTGWLEEHFREIFQEHYPSSRTSQLLNPKVTFLRREGNKMVFKLACAEKNQGRLFRLELDYQYDPATGWSMYSGQ
ncbi:hypothetical protein GF1_25830 [Desulfolithobacter dissulfuricans]|uniref:UBC core domain-containing protein n=1 Tax=Desulfolithobacter dissulfuricans TaxID=2795293 RepID=A0A915U6H9_9BACT|nr:ubiquitin-conjugating enzyme E2 [Desulfolithobacter dissulfuricans]BCO10207.1 hypothetical protein GF1_25830 [Desulfolithobacter dissulfuricans]